MRARSIGLNRSGHHYVPLHPAAKDSRASAARSEPAIDDLPQSSSEDSERDSVDERPPEPAEDLLRAGQPRTAAVTGDDSGISPFQSARDPKNIAQTYGKKAAASFTNIHGRPPSKKARTSSSARQTARGGDDDPGTSTTTAKVTTLMTRKRFQEPPAAAPKPKREFRPPVASPADPVESTRASTSPESLAKTSEPKATVKEKRVFKAPKSFETIAKALLGDEYADLQRVVTVESLPISSSLASSPLSSAASTARSPHSSAAPAGEAPLSLDIDDYLDEPDNICPICKAPVDEEQLDELRSSLAAQTQRQRKIVSQQTEFCRMHREADARKAWHERGYPDIDWPKLRTRLDKYRDPIEELLQGTRRSFFRERLQGQLESHRAGSKRARETLLQQFQRECDSSEDVGYYGGRGAALFMDFISNSFAPQLQKLRAQDSLMVACGGVASYQQLVLLPELCSLLVVDDQRSRAKANAPSKKRKKFKPIPSTTPSQAELEEARKTLRESAELGRLICEEENEDVLSTGSEDGGLDTRSERDS